MSRFQIAFAARFVGLTVQTTAFQLRCAGLLCFVTVCGYCCESELLAQRRRPPIRAQGAFIPPPVYGQPYPFAQPTPFLPGAMPPSQAVPPPQPAPLTTPGIDTNLPNSVVVVPENLFEGEVHAELSEKLLQLLIGRKENTSGPVQDMASGAVINGQQTTNSNVSVDCVPSTAGGQFDFVVQGLIQSATTATTPQANILQQGNTQFLGRKRVLLDGTSILTQRASVGVMPNTVVTGAKINGNLFPLFSQIGDRIAYRAAVAQTPRSNMIAGQKAIEKVQPELDQKIDQALSTANQQLKLQLWDRLEQWNVTPQRRAAFSTSDRLYWDYRLADTKIPLPTGTFPTSEPATSNSDLVVRIHDSLFTTAAQRRQLAGQTISLNQLQEATDRLLLLISEEVPTEIPELSLAITFTFDQNDPISARFDNDQLVLLMNGTFQAGNLPDTGTQQIRMLIKADINDQTITLEATDVTVREMKPDGSLEEPGLTQLAITTQLKSQLRKVILKRDLPVPPEMSQTLSMRLATMTAAHGWLTVEVDALPIDRQTLMPVRPADPLAPIPDPSFQPAPTFGPRFPTN